MDDLNQTVLQVGIISSDLNESQPLIEHLKNNQVDLCREVSLNQIETKHANDDYVHVWLVDLKEDDWSDGLDLMLEKSHSPVFINEQSALQNQSHPEFWVKQLIVRLGELVLELPSVIERISETATLNFATEENESEVSSPVVEPETALNQDALDQSVPVWVLGASLGGPAALKRFFQALPESLPVAFILVQHIDRNFISVFKKLVEEYSSFTVKLPEAANQLQAGEILIAPVEHKITMVSSGMVLKMDTAWTLPYSPCIDDVLVDVANHYANSGCIFFSGMGGDGVNGAKLMHEMQKPIWAQSQESCANSAMPDEIRNHGLSEFEGSPEELARQLSVLIHRNNHAEKMLEHSTNITLQERQYGNTR